MLKQNQISMMQNCDRFLDLTESTGDAIHPRLKNTTVQIVCNSMIHIFTYSHIMIIVHKIVNRIRKIKKHVRQKSMTKSVCAFIWEVPQTTKNNNNKTEKLPLPNEWKLLGTRYCVRLVNKAYDWLLASNSYMKLWKTVIWGTPLKGTTAFSRQRWS